MPSPDGSILLSPLILRARSLKQHLSPYSVHEHPERDTDEEVHLVARSRSGREDRHVPRPWPSPLVIRVLVVDAPAFHDPRNDAELDRPETESDHNAADASQRNKADDRLPDSRCERKEQRDENERDWTGRGFRTAGGQQTSLGD